MSLITMNKHAPPKGGVYPHIINAISKPSSKHQNVRKLFKPTDFYISQRRNTRLVVPFQLRNIMPVASSVYNTMFVEKTLNNKIFGQNIDVYRKSLPPLVRMDQRYSKSNQWNFDASFSSHRAVELYNIFIVNKAVFNTQALFPISRTLDGQIKASRFVQEHDESTLRRILNLSVQLERFVLDNALSMYNTSGFYCGGLFWNREAHMKQINLPIDDSHKLPADAMVYLYDHSVHDNELVELTNILKHIKYVIGFDISCHEVDLATYIPTFKLTNYEYTT